MDKKLSGAARRWHCGARSGAAFGAPCHGASPSRAELVPHDAWRWPSSRGRRGTSGNRPGPVRADRVGARAPDARAAPARPAPAAPAAAVKLNANRHVTGVLRGFDPFMNLVMDGTVDMKLKQDIGMVVRLAFLRPALSRLAFLRLACLRGAAGDAALGAGAPGPAAPPPAGAPRPPRERLCRRARCRRGRWVAHAHRCLPSAHFTRTRARPRACARACAWPVLRAQSRRRVAPRLRRKRPRPPQVRITRPRSHADAWRAPALAAARPPQVIRGNSIITIEALEPIW
jgi:hypothetical protein